VEVINKNTRFQYERSLAARSIAEQSDIYRADRERFKSQIAAIMLADMTWLYIRNGKMTSKIGLCRKHWKYRSKKTLPQIAHLRCRKSRCIAIGILTSWRMGLRDSHENEKKKVKLIKCLYTEFEKNLQQSLRQDFRPLLTFNNNMLYIF
jgi:hypothetical protein